MKGIVLDTETTGLERGSRTIELAAIMFDENDVIDTFETLVNPQMPIPPDATKTHGITDDMVDASPVMADVIERFNAWRDNVSMVVAHYALYDTGILSWDFGRLGAPQPADVVVVDTCDIARTIGATKKNSLDALVEHYGIQRKGQAHRAMCDADACLQYLFKVCRGDGDWPARLNLKPWSLAGHDYQFTSDLPAALADLPYRTSIGKPLTFVYQDDKGAQTERTVTPYGWAERFDQPGVVHFHGLCHLRSERRSFRADRVQAVID